MKTYHLTFVSKNKNSLNNAFLFFLTNFKTFKLNKYFQKKKQRKILTLLKSPHVNKTAQEQFENIVYSRQLSKSDLKIKKTLFCFKTVKKNLFADLKIKVKFGLNKKRGKKLKLSLLNPNNFQLTFNTHSYLQFKKRENKQNLLLTKQINKILKLFEIYGEISLKNNI